MRILITGGSGFIGTNLVSSLLSKGHLIINVDLVPPKVTNHKVFWKQIDIRNLDNLLSLMYEFDPEFIVHLAARVDLNGRVLRDYDTNVLGVQNVLFCASRMERLKKIIITSSMLVCDVGYLPKDQFDYSPSTIYGKSKVLTESLVWENMPSCDWAIIRPTSLWGPWFTIPYKTFFDMVLTGKYFHFGEGNTLKTYGFIGNSICQIEAILFSNTLNDSRKVYYIGDNPPLKVKDWANEIAKEENKRIKVVPYFIIKILSAFGDVLKLFGVDFPMNSFRLRNMTTENVINLDLTYELLPEVPFTLNDGVKQTLEWLKEQRDIGI